jgi:uncharacterized membrane protein YfcA
MVMTPEIALMGLLVGFLVGLTGVGGAALLTPILVIMGVNPVLAVGTDLIYNSITKLFGTIQHWRQKTIDFQLTKYLALGSVPSAIVAVGVVHIFGSFHGNQEAIIKHSLGIVLIIVAVATLAKQFIGIKPNAWQSKPLNDKRGLTIIMGAVLGFIVGLTSVGSGSLFALAMLYLYRMTASQLVGTDIAHAFILVSVAGFLYAGFGNVDYLLVANLLIGSIPGVVMGSSLSAKVPAKPLRTIMAALILISGIKLI